MQLSKLEIKGFKSFGEKITIHFDKGVTGIVGPNGCGKSNVVDAIRWVLGEQKTRNLRSDKMENLIFNGTKNRKPLQMAEVSLTFLNDKNILPTEYSQVTISRRYYRNGDSEYLLNGVGCRLKDITSLFLDTGIGPDSYAIIELKMVDDILSDRENSRRSLLEEAAGISKFKLRKKETFRKLEDTEGDLSRLEDVLFEIRKNMKALEKQARQAEEYYEIKESYKKASIEFARLHLAARSESMRAVKAQLTQIQDERTAASTSIAVKEGKLEEVRAQIVLEEKTLSGRQKTLNDYTGKIKEIENQKKIREDRQAFYTQRSEKLTIELTQLLSQQEILKKQSEELKRGETQDSLVLENLENEFDSAQKELEIYKLNTAENRQMLEVNQEEFLQKTQKAYELEKSIEFADTQRQDLENELKKAQVATEDQTVFLGNFEKKLDQLDVEIQKRERHISESEKLEAQLELEIAKKIIQSDAHKEKLAELYRRLDARQNELNLTRALVENLEGFPEAVKFLRKNKSWSKKAPLVADILNINEKYSIALEAVLEPFLNFYVVQSEIEAYLAMKLLSEGKKGKANFLILDRLKGFRSSQTAEIKDAISAKSLVEYDSQYENLVSYLLENVYITDRSIPFATGSAETPVLFDELSWDWDNHTVVSISGAMTQRPFSVSGGSISVFEGNKIGKAVQVKKLETEISDINLLIHNEKLAEEQNNEELLKLRQSTQKSLIEHFQKELNQFRNEQVALQARKEQSLELLRTSSERKEIIEEKIKQLEETLNLRKPELAALKHSTDELKALISKLQESYKTGDAEMQKSARIVNETQLQLVNYRNAISRRLQELEFRNEEFQKLEVRRNQAQTELDSVKNELVKLGQTDESSNKELPGLYAEKQAIEEGLNEAERSYFEAKGHADNLEKEIRELNRKREQLAVLLSENQEALSLGQSQLAAIQERIHVEFGETMTWEEDLPEPNPVEEEKWLKKSQSIKNQLDKIGPINLMAREAYQEIKERNDFIESQKKDLTEARDSLIKTISEIEKVAREAFLATFSTVQENFKMVFRSLFTSEDTCDLILTDSQNPLDSSIDIMARPKGKRPLTINQLSGGEKTLTAISLLFAIYLIKPAPFCIFDEADAPLDDSNIDKFNNIIRTFSDRSQFIIVTHNKRTMASTDVIYGVTMPEQGVSRVIPVDLRELV